MVEQLSGRGTSGTPGERSDANAHLREEFVALAGHELRTPVTVLKLQVEMAKRAMARKDAPTAESMASLLDVVDRQIGRLARICEEMLDAAQVQAELVELAWEEGDLADIVREAVELGRARRAPSASPIEVRIERGLVGRWDSARLCRALAHLVENALAFGEGKPVEVRMDVSGGRALIAVRDHGIGIARRDQARIFERFERAVPASHFGGLGLGLYVARAIVAAHGGSIRVESERGAGSTFVVELPLPDRVGGNVLQREAA